MLKYLLIPMLLFSSNSMSQQLDDDLTPEQTKLNQVYAECLTKQENLFIHHGDKITASPDLAIESCQKEGEAIKNSMGAAVLFEEQYLFVTMLKKS